MPMEPVDIREVWPTVRRSLEKKARTSDDAMPMIPEDIYACCVNQQAFLYMDPDRTEKGFAVVQSQWCPFERISNFCFGLCTTGVWNTDTTWISGRIARNTGHHCVEFVTSTDAIGRLTRSSCRYRAHRRISRSRRWVRAAAKCQMKPRRTGL